MNLSPRKTISALFIKRVEKQKDQIAIGSIKNDKLDFINFEKTSGFSRIGSMSLNNIPVFGKSG